MRSTGVQQNGHASATSTHNSTYHNVLTQCPDCSNTRGSETINTNALKRGRHTKSHTSQARASVEASVTQFAHTIGNKNIFAKLSPHLMKSMSCKFLIPGADYIVSSASMIYKLSKGSSLPSHTCNNAIAPTCHQNKYEQKK